MKRTQSGNAFVITLISVILLGALTFVLTRQMNATVPDQLSDEKASLYAERFIAQANAMQLVIQQMLQTGASVETLNFDEPSSGTFNSGNTMLKVYHPAGGGYNYSPLPLEARSSSWSGSGLTDYGWHFQYGYNVEWTPTAATDIIYTLMGLTQQICEKINLKLTGDATIPTASYASGSPYNALFSNGATDANFMAADCAGCDGKQMLCVKDGTTNYGMYAIVLGR